jgi:branched-subunit amino acid ABC-type transport system permease component
MDLSEQIAQYVITGLSIGAIYAIVAMGFNIIHNTTGIVNFAQCEFISLGGMLMYTLVVLHRDFDGERAYTICQIKRDHYSYILDHRIIGNVAGDSTAGLGNG